MNQVCLNNKLFGIAVSKGIANGNAFVIKTRENDFSHFADNSKLELSRFLDAIDKFEKENEEKAFRLNEKERKILLGHTVMVKDPYVFDSIKKEIENKKTAEKAVFDVFEKYIKLFENSNDKITIERCDDIKDVRNGIIEILQNKNAKVSDIGYNSVVVVKELTPSLISSLDREKVVAVISENGSETSHSAILARTLEIPSILSVKSATEIIKDGDTLIVDTENSQITINPSIDEIIECEKKKEKIKADNEKIKKYLTLPCLTKDSKRISIYSNAGTFFDVERGIKVNTEGVGLFRTEFLYMDREIPITEEEQFQIYKKCVTALKGKPLTIRTLDIGGDKNVKSLDLKKEENPFLGFRAIRFCLNRDDVFIPQLTAILKASAYGKIRIMLPLVTTANEILSAKEKIECVKMTLSKKKIDFDSNIEVGIMVETPSAAISAEKLIKYCDFFSIGTNDLVQYIMAVDRGNKDVKYLYSPLEPPVIKAIKHISDCARNQNKEVGMCGEQATDKTMIPLLVSLLDEFSVNPAFLLKTKYRIAKYTTDFSKWLVNEALKCDTKAEIENLIKTTSQSQKL